MQLDAVALIERSVRNEVFGSHRTVGIGAIGANQQVAGFQKVKKRLRYGSRHSESCCYLGGRLRLFEFVVELHVYRFDECTCSQKEFIVNRSNKVRRKKNTAGDKGVFLKFGCS